MCTRILLKKPAMYTFILPATKQDAIRETAVLLLHLVRRVYTFSCSEHNPYIDLLIKV